MSMPSSVALTPNWLDSRVWSATSAAWSSALVGMQPDVEAGAAQVALLDEADGETELGGAERTGVAAGSGPENEYVELAVGHPPILALFARRLRKEWGQVLPLLPPPGTLVP